MLYHRLLLFILALLLSGPWAYGLNFSADRSQTLTEQGIVELFGNVRLTNDSYVLQCDYAKVYWHKHSIYAKGHVLLLQGEEKLFAEEVLFDLETGEAFLKNGTLQTSSLYLESQFFHRKADGSYLAEGAKYTTCQNCPESWSFLSRQIRAVPGSYAYMKNLFLRVGGVPVFWLPYLVVPLKTERQTGFLTPEFETSQIGGATLTQSFFWAISPSQDLTITLKNYEKRGLKSLWNYRYMLSEHSWGEALVSLIQDRTLVDDQRFVPFESQPNTERRLVLYKHLWQLPDDTEHRMQLNYVSDLRYLTDFPLEAPVQGVSYLENRTSLSNNLAHRHRSIEAAYYLNLAEANPRASNEWSVHRWPHIRLSEAGQSWKEWMYSWDIQWTQFQRGQIPYDNLNAPYSSGSNPPPRHVISQGSGACGGPDWYQYPACQAITTDPFEPGKDLIRQGERLMSQGQLHRTWRVDPLGLSWTTTAHALAYRFPLLPVEPAYRTFASMQGTLFTEFYGRSLGGRWEHRIFPRISATWIPGLAESANHPFLQGSSQVPFSPNSNISNLDLNSPWGLQFDYFDRVSTRKMATAGLYQEWIENQTDTTKSNKQITRATWSLEQSYDFYQAERSGPNRQPLSELISHLNVFADSVHFYGRLIYFPYQYVSNTSSFLSFPFESGEKLVLGHNRFYNLTPGQPVNPQTRIEDGILELRKQARSFYVLSRMTYDLNPDSPTAYTFKSYGAAVQMRLPGNCWYVTLTHYKVLAGDSITFVNFDFLWDPKQTPKVDDSFLAQIGF